MGGGIQRNEPIDHQVRLGDIVSYEMFRIRGWLYYFLSLNGFDEEVTLQFMTTLRNGVIVVKGLRIEFSKEVIAKVTRFP